EWIEFVTWNDFDEASYMSPIDDVVKYWPYVANPTLGYYKSHVGFLALTKFYINWYKYYPATQSPPPPAGKDNVFWFYRTHPQAAVASADPLGPVIYRNGMVEDKIYVTTILVAAAELRVTTGGVVRSYPVPAGITHTRVPFQAGTQRFELYRAGVQKGVANGDMINASISVYNFNYTSGVLQTSP
ncbi:MAG TPA: endo-1,3-alpha-glucanase family glycosylhydrolase, partial [Chryseolinea sp.]